MLENFAELSDHIVSSGGKIKSRIQHVTHSVDTAVIQGGDAIVWAVATSPVGAGRRCSNGGNRNEEEKNSRGEHANNFGDRSFEHVHSSTGEKIKAKIQHVTHSVETVVSYGGDAITGALAASTTGTQKRCSNQRDDAEENLRANHTDTSIVNSSERRHSNSSDKLNMSTGEKMQTKIQHVTQCVEDAIVYSGDTRTKAVASFHTGSGKKYSNARGEDEGKTRDIQQSHISVESNFSGETEVRLRSENSVRLIDSSFKEESSKDSPELLDLALTLLRIVPCDDASLENLKLHIKVSDDGSGDEDVQPDLDVAINTTESMMILGGKQHCHKFLSFADSKLHLKLVRIEVEEEIVCESFLSLSRILNKTKASSCPNRWINLGQNKEGKSLGKIQLRLVSNVSVPILHKLESCKVLTPGPGMALTPMKSYALRKMALYSVAPVFLHVYDVSNNDRVQHCNYYFKALGAGGIFHSSIEIYGREYSFGGTKNHQSLASGIFDCSPKRCPVHHYRESVYLGDCELSKVDVDGILNHLKYQWMARDYDLLRKNCCFFSQELAIQLGVGNIPGWVYSLAETGRQFEPYVKAYLTRKKNTARAVSKPTTSDTPKTANAHETMLDHAMASRIQRSFRKKKTTSISSPKPQVSTSKTMMLDHTMASRIQRSFRKKKPKATNSSKIQVKTNRSTISHPMVLGPQRSYPKKKRATH